MITPSYDDTTTTTIDDDESMSWSFCNQEHEKQCDDSNLLSSSSSSVLDWESEDYQCWITQDNNLFDDLPFTSHTVSTLQSITALKEETTSLREELDVLKDNFILHNVDTLQLTTALKEEIIDLKDEMKILKENFYYYFPETGRKRRQGRSNSYPSSVTTQAKQKKQRCV